MSTSRTLALGIGNLLWADEGFGVRALEALHQRFAFADDVSLVDGGTQGVYLLDHVTSASQLLVFDAIDCALPPGSLKVLRDADVPSSLFGKSRAVSLHQASFQELLALAQWQGHLPSRITVIGVQPVLLDDLGGSLTPAVRARLDEAVTLAVAELAAWGVVATPRAGSGAPSLNAAALALHAYESGRPSAAMACRVGDARFMPPQPQPELA